MKKNDANEWKLLRTGLYCATMMGMVACGEAQKR